MTLTPEGRERAMNDADYLLGIESGIDLPGVQTLGLYAVLGQYDFVTLVEAPGNEAIARFSIELGVRAGVHITTLPVIPASRLNESDSSMSAAATADLQAESSTERPR